MNSVVPVRFQTRVNRFLEDKIVPALEAQVSIAPEEVAQRQVAMDRQLDEWRAQDNAPGDSNPAAGVIERDLEGTNGGLRIQLGEENGLRAASVSMTARETGEVFESPFVYFQSDGKQGLQFTLNAQGDGRNTVLGYLLNGSAGTFLLGSDEQPTE